MDNSDDSQKTPTQPIIALPPILFKEASQPTHLPNLMPGPHCLELPSVPSVPMEQQPDIQAKFIHILSRPPKKLYLSVCHMSTRGQS